MNRELLFSTENTENEEKRLLVSLFVYVIYKHDKQNECNNKCIFTDTHSFLWSVIQYVTRELVHFVINSWLKLIVLYL